LVSQVVYNSSMTEQKKFQWKKGIVRFIRWCVWFFILMSLCAGVITCIGVYFYFAEELPEISSFNDFHPPLITTVYSDDNQKIAEFYRERRIIIPLSDMPNLLVKAFIASEDSRFFSHNGVDIFGIVRAFFKNMEAGTIVQGGSTITQQVVKPYLTNGSSPRLEPTAPKDGSSLGLEPTARLGLETTSIEPAPAKRSYSRKFKEAILAYRFDRAFTKEDILFRYLNQIYFGYGAYGVEAAAENYFGKHAKELNLAESAMLAGLPKAPGEYSPSYNLEKAKERQKYVLDRMILEGYITQAQAQEALKTRIEIKHKRQNWYMDKVPFFSEHIRRYIEEKFGADALYSEGFQIYTTVNIQMQDAAQEELEKGLKELEDRQKYPNGLKPQGAFVCIEAGTGHVKAMVGGRNFEETQLNRAVQSRRQPGSSFKPIIYAAAIDKGYTPLTVVYDRPITFRYKNSRVSWSPSNYDRKFYGPIRLRKALAKSRNVPAVRVLRDIGIDYAIDYAKKLGIESELTRNLCLALGPSGVSLLELTTAYSVFTNLGELVHPVFITKILDRYGREVNLMKTENEKAIAPATAYVMTNLLESVVKEGTAKKILELNRPAAGKTGTSSDLRDAWFIGYTPDYIAGTWVGFDIERPLGESETGSRAAAPIWLGFMQRVLTDKPVRGFKVPDEGVVFANIDSRTGLLSASYTRNTVIECFKKGAEPTRSVTPPRPHPKELLPLPQIIAKPDHAASPQKVITSREDFFKSSM